MGRVHTSPQGIMGGQHPEAREARARESWLGASWVVAVFGKWSDQLAVCDWLELAWLLRSVQAQLALINCP